MGAPLRPLAEDVSLFERLVGAAAGERAGRAVRRAALLGVTPEIARMRWPRGTRLAAFDRCPGMIAEVWPRAALAPETRAHATRADWRVLPVADGTFDVVVGDGCYTLLDAPAGFRGLGAEAARVLAPGGAFVMRFFVRPERAEPLDDVFAALAAGEIGSFHAFKWRLAMALHGTLAEGVAVAAVWAAWASWVAREGGADALAARLGWPAAEVRTIDAYRDAPARYTFPTLAEARELLGEHFVERGCHVGAYELGERCPTLLLTPRSP